MAREARKRKPRIRVPRGHEACRCCDGYGTHDDRAECRRCEGDGHLTAGSRKPLCGDQGGSQRRTASLQTSRSEPFEFEYARNTISAPKMHNGEYGQDIEPHGRYMTVHEPMGNYVDSDRMKWEFGHHRFENPLHLDAEGWKQRLSEQHGGKTGRELSQAVRDAGHDGIVTHETSRGRSFPGEIVDLTGFKRQAAPLRRDSSGFFHGTRATTPLRVGDHIETGHESAMQMSDNDKVYFTHDPQGAEKYARGTPRAGVKVKGKPVVYEVEPTGPFHKDPGSPGWRTPHPLRVTRVHQVPHAPLRQTGYTMPARGPMSNGGAERHPLYAGKDEEYEGDAQHFEDMWYGDDGRDMDREAARALPTDRIFGPTYGLDHRLFTGDKLHPDVIEAIMNRLDQVLRVDSGLTGSNWMDYIEVYLAGSEASEWTSPTLEGNNDFDTLLGVNYDELRGNDGRGASAQWIDKTNDEINDVFNDVLRRMYNDEDWHAPFGGVWHLTGYVNGDAYDIRRIKPYAAYDLNKDAWAVKPPHLPDWKPESFPQGPALWKQAEAIAEEIEAILELPEPYRTQQGASLYDHLHEDRHRAFGDNGEGWYDNGNVIEKYLDQLGLWAKLLHLKKNSEHETFDDGEQPFLEAMAAKTAVDATGSMMVAFVPPDEVLDHLVQEDGEERHELHITLLYLGKETAFTSKQITQLPVLVQQWAKTQQPLKAATQGAGTFLAKDNHKDSHVLWASVNIPHVSRAHDGLVDFLRGHGLPIKEQFGYIPHITLRYDKYHVRFLPKIEPMSWDITEVWFCRNKDWIPFKLGG